MSIWTLLEVFLWVAVAGGWMLLALAAWAAARIARWLYTAAAWLVLRTWARLQGSPLADPDPLADDVSEEHGYAHAEDLAEMRRLGHLAEKEPQIPTRPGPLDTTYQQLEAMYAKPARTEENQ